MSGSAESVRVLIADDDASTREMLSELVEDETGGEALAVADGAALLALAAERRPDLVMLDLLMPGVDGWEACRRLKSDPATAQIPVLVVSGAKAGAELGSIGCDAYVEKPIDLDRLIALVRRLVRRSIARGTSRTALRPAQLARERLAELQARLAAHSAAVATARERSAACQEQSRALLARLDRASARAPPESGGQSDAPTVSAVDPLDAIAEEVRAQRAVMDMLAGGIAVADGDVEAGVELMMLRLLQGRPGDDAVADTLISHALRLVEAEARAATAAEAEAHTLAAARVEARAAAARRAAGRVDPARASSVARATARALGALADALSTWRSARGQRAPTSGAGLEELLREHRELVADFQALRARVVGGELDPEAHAAFQAQAERLIARLRSAT